MSAAPRSTRIRARLAERGLSLPAVAAPVAAYVPAVASGHHVHTSGQLPFVDGTLPLTGKVGAEVTPEQAAEQTVVATRRFARRQETWFRADPRVHWVDALAPDVVAQALAVVAGS